VILITFFSLIRRGDGVLSEKKAETVKRAALRTQWLSACSGSNPGPCNLLAKCGALNRSSSEPAFMFNR